MSEQARTHRIFHRLRQLVLLSAALVATWPAGAAAQRRSPFDWPEARRETRPWSYWWWMGSAVDAPNITRELETYRKAGWGGLHLIPIYGARGAESRYIEYLSPQWMAMLKHAVSEGQRLGMGIDMTTGSGWCFGGPGVTPEQASAVVVSKIVEVEAGKAPSEKFAKESLQALIAVSPDGRATDLTGRVGPDGSLDWRAEGGTWRLYAVSQRAATRVKRAAPGGTGFMLNPFYRPAIDSYLERFSQAFAAYDGPRPRSMYHDSFEYGANWSPNLLAEFEKRRGYRLQDEFASLFGKEETDRAARVKSDYRETLAELLREDFLSVWTGWSRRQGFFTRNQAHGSPGNLLDLYAEAEIPETEMFNRDRSTVISKFASSAAHVAGRKLVSSETGTWLNEHFNTTLAQMKDLVDQLWLSGVNHVIYHGSNYSPDNAAWPGWLFYASTQMNWRNSIWHDVPALNSYITRAQSFLQLGEAANDVLVYWPVYDVWHNPKGLAMNFTVHTRTWVEGQPFGTLAERLLERGYAFDFISDRQLEAASAESGEVRTAGGRYRTIVVPATGHMPLATMEKLLSLARAGATVIFENDLPADVPGLSRLPERRERLNRLRGEVQLAPAAGGIRAAETGTGRVLVGGAEACLREARSLREPMADSGLQFIRRAASEGTFYFIVNRSAKDVDGWIPLSANMRAAVLLDPMTGRTGRAAARRNRDSLEVYLQLAAGESVIVQTLIRSVQGPSWTYWRNGGESVPLSGQWDVEFTDGGPERPAPQKMSTLSSWTASGDARAAAFAGTARYSLRFDAPFGASAGWSLQLGHVAESARVRLNGRDLGTVFAPPFRIALPALKRTDNVLEVEVTNTSANRVRDLDVRKVPWKIFHDINIVGVDYKPLDASRWPLRDSGLLGPVGLQRLERLNPFSAR